jgi:hypothetical protein
MQKSRLHACRIGSFNRFCACRGDGQSVFTLFFTNEIKKGMKKALMEAAPSALLRHACLSRRAWDALFSDSTL